MSKSMVVLSLPYAESRFGPISRVLVEAEVLWKGDKTMKVRFRHKLFADLPAVDFEKVMTTDDKHVVEFLDK